MYIQSVVVWSYISNIEARANEIKAKGGSTGYLICLNLFLDLIPRSMGMTNAWRCTKKNSDLNVNLINFELVRNWQLFGKHTN